MPERFQAVMIFDRCPAVRDTITMEDFPHPWEVVNLVNAYHNRNESMAQRTAKLETAHARDEATIDILKSKIACCREMMRQVQFDDKGDCIFCGHTDKHCSCNYKLLLVE